MKFGVWLEQSREVVPNFQTLNTLQYFYITLSFSFLSYHLYSTLLPHESNMSKSFMTSISSSSSSSSSLTLSHDYERPDLESIWALVISVNQFILEFITNAKTWNSLKLRCTSKLNIQRQEFFEFSDHSVVSNLYWGIYSIEPALHAKWSEEKSSRLRNSERMLQVSALLDEHGVTAGIPNHFLVCCSYFYLSVVRKLQWDEWQAALHFLQALLVFPRLIRTEFAPELCEVLFPSSNMSRMQEAGSLASVSLVDFREDIISEAMRKMARRYKHWLMYHKVMLYGETPLWHCGRRDISSLDDDAQYVWQGISSSTQSSKLTEHGHSLQTYCNQYEKVHPFDPQQDLTDGTIDEPKVFSNIPEIQDYSKAPKRWNQIPVLQLHNRELKKNPSIKCLQDMLKESQSDMSTSVDDSYNDSEEDSDMEANMEDTKSSLRAARISADDPQTNTCDQTLQALCSTSSPDGTEIVLQQALQHPMHNEANDVYITKFFPGRFLSSISDLNLSTLELRDKKSKVPSNFHVEDGTVQSTLQPHKVEKHIAPTVLQNCRFTQMDHHQGNAAAGKQNSSSWKKFNEVLLHAGKDSKNELMEVLEKAISKICFSEELGKCNEDYVVEVTTIYKMLNSKTGVKYAMLKDMILDHLLTAISSSKEVTIIRASVSMLTNIISADESVIEDIKKKGLQLRDLANALKQNVDEAAILIYLIKPSPTEIKTLEILPTLVEVVCTSNSYKGRLASVLLTPPAASLMIIEILVTAFDYATNNMHLAAINSLHVLCGLLEVARNHSLEEFIPLATILIKCMQFDGQCRKYISQFTPVAPFICLLQSDEKQAKFIALEYFHEILCMPRSSCISLLQQIREEGSIDIMHALLLCVQQLQPDYQLLAANLLLQLDTLENSSGERVFREEAVQVLLKSLASEESSTTQLLSASILSNIGGTYAWTGEPYTVAWLVKKAGLTSMYHRNMIRNFDWLDQSLQDDGTDAWCSKIARSIIDIGKPVFHALEKGLKSKIKRVSRDSLTAISWLSCEIAKSPNSLRYSACEILLSGIEQFLHPGLELEERLLACWCIYNYACGKGRQKLIHFSEGVRESLRRFSNITWMAEELHKVADYYLPNKSRISCVHTQILEASHNCSGAVSALIYYKGLLCSGFSDGSIKVWDIKRQSATLVWDVKEHKKAVTCFSLLEPAQSLLSGSADKTIRAWQIVHGKLECIEVIAAKEPIQKLDTYGQMIFVITKGHRLKVFDSSRTVKDICKSKNVKCMRVVQGKVYIGCMDSSIQEIAIRPTTNNREREIKAPTKSWRMQNKPINSIVVYKDWLYSASSNVEGSNIKEWKRHHEPHMSLVTGGNVLEMGVVEDFIYLNCSSSMSILQIWLRGAQQKVGRISAGSRITSLLTANDIVLCGTEKGLIKGWIPL